MISPPRTHSTTSLPILRYSTFGLLVILPVTFLQLYFSGNWYAIAHSYSLAMFFGIFSYCLLCCTLLISTRIRYLDRLFGHEKVLRFHGNIAALSIFTGSIHYVLKQGYLEKTTFQSVIGFISLSIFIVIMLITLLLLTSGFLITIPFLSRLRSFASNQMKLDYSRVKLIHNGFSFAVVLLLIHVFIASSTQESLLRMSFTGILGGAALARYLYHKLVRPRSNRKMGYSLEKIEQPAANFVRLTFSTTPPQQLSFIPGQFCYLRISAPETGNEEHPFTLSSSPEDPVVQMTIKNLGNFTSQLKNLKEHTPVILDGPYGTFTPSTDDRNKIFIAGGIGITPFLSILSSWYRQEDIPETVLLWSVQREKELIDEHILRQMAKKRPWFTFIPVLTQEQSQKFRHGRISDEVLADTLANVNVLETDIYICGPAAMIRNLQRYCIFCGVPHRNIHFEQFSF